MRCSGCWINPTRRSAGWTGLPPTCSSRPPTPARTSWPALSSPPARAQPGAWNSRGDRSRVDGRITAATAAEVRTRTIDSLETDSAKGGGERDQELPDNAEVFTQCPYKWFIETHLRPSRFGPAPPPIVRGEADPRGAGEAALGSARDADGRTIAAWLEKPRGWSSHWRPSTGWA